MNKRNFMTTRPDDENVPNFLVDIAEVAAVSRSQTNIRLILKSGEAIDLDGTKAKTLEVMRTLVEMLSQ